MTEQLLTIITLLSPVLFVLTAIASEFQSGIKPKLVIGMSTFSTIAGILIAGIGSYFVYQHGLAQSSLIGVFDVGFSVRLDQLSMLMFGMIALLGFIIVKFSINYMDGDQRHGSFMGRIALTIASVQMLVISGNLGVLLISWIVTSISLHRLLAFYNDRPGARIAARKKFLLARLGDVCLLISFGLLYSIFQTGNLEVIFSTIQNTSASNLPFISIELAALFLALAAILKSAQFPTHGWLLEVVETPTPVSSLLHAGLLNAGPFLIIRMAYVMDASTIAPILLIVVGGLTALFASVVYMTQTSIKTALGYSSIGHMGFSLMTSGLGVYSAAMLHLVAHSFYKAHCFLSSGSVIDGIRSSRIVSEKKEIKPVHVVLAFLISSTLYSVFALNWGINPENEFSLFIIGAVIVMGLTRILATALTTHLNTGLIVRAIGLALIVTTAFFVLESAMHLVLSVQIPALTMPNSGKLIAACLILIAFAGAISVQILAPMFAEKPFYQAFAIHVRNGFYANAYFDRVIEAMHIHSTEPLIAFPETKVSGSLQDQKQANSLVDSLA